MGQSIDPIVNINNNQRRDKSLMVLVLVVVVEVVFLGSGGIRLLVSQNYTKNNMNAYRSHKYARTHVIARARAHTHTDTQTNPRKQASKQQLDHDSVQIPAVEFYNVVLRICIRFFFLLFSNTIIIAHFNAFFLDGAEKSEEL